MILKPGNPWGRLRGKLKTTPEQALKQFQFVQKADSKGILFREYTYLDDNNKKKRGTFVSNYNPPSDPKTPTQQTMRQRFGTISKIALTHRTELVDPIWGPIAKTKPHSYGCNEFRSQNLKVTGLPPDWTKLLIADGNLAPTPEIYDYYYMGQPPYPLVITFNPYSGPTGKPSDTVNAYLFLRITETLYKLTPIAIFHREDEMTICPTPEIFPLTFIIVFIFFTSEE